MSAPSIPQRCEVSVTHGPHRVLTRDATPFTCSGVDELELNRLIDEAFAPRVADLGWTSVADAPLMTPGEVAQLLRVSPKTVSRWASTGRLRSVRTPGGHRRFYTADVRALLATVDDPTP